MIDENSAIGVMHLGQFPDGVEFATFVMSRYSYEFELMSMDDYRLLNADPGTRPPAPAELAGRWEGRMITQAHPTISLMTKPHPVSVSGTFAPDGASSLFKIAGIDALWTGGKIGDVRLVNPDTLIGRWDLGPKLGWLAAVQDCVEPNEGHFWVHFVLSRKP